VSCFKAGSTGEGVDGEGCRCGCSGLLCPENFRGEEGRRSIGEGATYPAGVLGGLEGCRGKEDI
jgi:hypothetical protein